MIFPDGNVCVARGCGDPLGAARQAMPDIGRVPQRRERPSARNPEGRGLLRREFVEGLARSPGYGASPFSCPRRKIPAAQALPSGKIML
jgi:hypothetical protein